MNRYAINQNWLEAVGKEIPFSFEITTSAATDMDFYGLNFLLNSCGVHSENYVQIDDGVVSFAPSNDAYRDFLEFANKLYANGLLDMDGFVQQTTNFYAKGVANRLSVIGHHSYVDLVCGPENMDQYVPMLPMQDKNGKVAITGRAIDGDFSYDQYKVSATCEYPEAAVRLYDYVNADEEHMMLWSWGPDGSAYSEREDCVRVKATEFEEGITNVGAARHTYAAGMQGFWIMTKDVYDKWEVTDRKVLMNDFEEMYKPYLAESIPAGVDN